jgi:hypothetical protein
MRHPHSHNQTANPGIGMGLGDSNAWLGARLKILCKLDWSMRLDSKAVEESMRAHQYISQSFLRKQHLRLTEAVALGAPPKLDWRTLLSIQLPVPICRKTGKHLAKHQMKLVPSMTATYTQTLSC